MSGHYIRKRVRSAGWSWSLAVFSGALLLVAVAFFRLGALDFDGLSLAVFVVAGLAALALLLAFFAIGRAWGRGDRGGGRAVAGLFVGLVVAIPFALGAALAIEYPFGNAAMTRGFSEAAEPPAGGYISARDYRATAADVYSVARATMESRGWSVLDVETRAMPELPEGDLGVSGTVLAPVPTLRDTLDQTVNGDPLAAMDSDEYTLTALATAPVLGFPSDITVRIVEEEGVSYVDVRSVSRDLPRDLGQNRRFIESFYTNLDSAMTLLQSGPVED